MSVQKSEKIPEDKDFMQRATVHNPCMNYLLDLKKRNPQSNAKRGGMHNF